jgi:bla regulator protein BlaR1
MAYESLTSLGPLVGDHLWQSTIFAIAIGILARTWQSNQARLRYWLWLAASLKFLLPFSLLTAIGLHLGPRLVSSPAAPQMLLVVDEITGPLTPLQRVVATEGPSPFRIFAFILLFGIWGLGCAGVLIQSWRRWRQVRAIVRGSAPLRTGRAAALWSQPRTSALANALGIELVSSQAALEPGVFGILRPVLYLPARIADSLSESELDAILRHELCHARRRDNLTAALHVVVQAIFWFHPLVWWLGSRLIEERERACDEYVLQSGVEPRVYAQGILQVCTQCLRSPSTWVAGVTGSSLKNRIEEIMTNRIVTRLTPGRKVFLAAAALLAVIGPVTIGIMNGPRLSAQPSNTPMVETPSGPKFEVASIKPAPITNSGPPANAGIKIDGARVDIGYWSIDQLIHRAYGLPGYQLSGPGWTNDLRFDVVAKFPEGATKDQLPEMLQWLLADRFGLVAHTETRELPGFDLVVGKGGPKVKLSEPDAGTDPASPNRLERAGQLLDRLSSYDPKALGMVSWKTMPGVLHAEFKRMPMEALAQVLADRLKAPVINMTGLEGEYQMTLDLPIPGSSAGTSLPGVELPPELEPVSVSLFSTVERLGLKLIQRKTPIEVLVVDTVNRVPTAN